MKKVKYLSYGLAIVSASVIGLTGCGGGGSSSEPNTNLYDLRTWIDTAEYTITGSGTITVTGNTIPVTGTYQSIYLGTSTAPTGVTVHDHDVTMILSGAGITEIQSANSSTYMGYIVYTENTTSGVTCETPLTPADITPVPTDAQVGYISSVIPLECSNGTYVTTAIRLTDAGGGNATFSLISNIYASQGGALLSSETDNIVVTPNMSMVSANISGSIPADDITFNIDSTSIVQD